MWAEFHAPAILVRCIERLACLHMKLGETEARFSIIGVEPSGRPQAHDTFTKRSLTIQGYPPSLVGSG